MVDPSTDFGLVTGFIESIDRETMKRPVAKPRLKLTQWLIDFQWPLH